MQSDNVKMETLQDLKIGPILVLFFLMVFLLNFYDLFFLLEPVRDVGIGKKPTLGIYTFFNFSFRLLFYCAKFFILVSIVHFFAIVLHNQDLSQALRMKALIILVILLEFILLSEKVYKIIYFEFVQRNYTFDDCYNFQGLVLFEPDTGAGSFMSRLANELNAFHLVYCIALWFGLRALYKLNEVQTTLFFICAYFVPLLLWNLVLSFTGF